VTERRPRGVRVESWVERQIREAEERGAFDNLPGAGKPLPGLGKPHDEMWWIRQKMAREGVSADALLPESLKLPIRPKVGGPRAARNRCYTSRIAVAVVGLVTNGTVRKEIAALPETVRGLPSEHAVRAVVTQLNARIAEWLRAPSGPLVRVVPVRADEVVERWRADRARARPAAVEPPSVPAQRRRRWWRRRG
jgi:hypothetical protein